LVLGQFVEAALLGFFVNLGAPYLAAAGNDVHRCFLAAFQFPNHRVDHTVVDEGLKALRDFHLLTPDP
jgi:hypothetical protein